MSRTITKTEDYANIYRDRLDSVGRALDNARMEMKHKRRLLKMRQEGVKIK